MAIEINLGRIAGLTFYKDRERIGQMATKKPDLEFYFKDGRNMAKRLKLKGQEPKQIIEFAIEIANRAKISAQKRAVLSSGLASVLLK